MTSDIPDEAVTAGSGSVYEHRLNYDDFDGEGRVACICGQWREPGLMDGDEYDWGHHVARAVLSAALPVLNTAKDSETEALRAELGQHRSGESYEIGENYGRTTQANSCVRDLLEAVYPGDPMPDRPLDTIWEHLLNAVRAYAVEVGQLRTEVAELRRRDAEYAASLRGEQGE